MYRRNDKHILQWLMHRLYRGLRGILLMLPVINFFGIPIPSYMFCAVLGFCAALFFALQRNQHESIKWKAYYIFIAFAVGGLFIGGKVLFFITMLPEVLTSFSLKKTIVIFVEGGIVFYGGLFGALFFGKLSARISKEDPRDLLNLFIPPFVLFHAFGRVGCFMAGCCYGVECSFGFSYPQEPGVLRFPVQLVEAFGNLIIISILLYMENRSHGKKSLTVLYLLMYATMRFLLEFLRGDSIRGIWFALSTSQWISIITVVVILVRVYKNHRSNAS